VPGLRIELALLWVLHAPACYRSPNASGKIRGSGSQSMETAVIPVPRQSDAYDTAQTVKHFSPQTQAARRARLILLLAEGHTWDEVSERIECSRGFVASWNKRFVDSQ
jgi:hypothetical protein